MNFWSTAAVAALLYISPKTCNAAPSGFVDEQVFQGQRAPTGLVFTPQDQMIVVHKKGRVTVWQDPDGDYSYSKKTTALDMRNVVCDNGERGLGGVALHPKFGVSNRYIYLYYTYDATGACLQDKNRGPVNRLSRFVLSKSWKINRDSEKVLFQTPPLAKRVHNGGSIEFGKDGYIYVSTGEADVTEEAQNLGSLLGKMIRITEDGEIPSDNPFARDPKGHRCNKSGRVPANVKGGKCQELYAIGLRNPWRFAMNPNTAGNKVQFYINDVGASAWEEISEGGDDFSNSRDKLGITNYGWPRREGPCRRGRKTKCDDYNGYNHPIHYYRHTDDGRAATGSAFIPNGIWPEKYNNGYLYSDYVTGKIYLLKDSGEQDCLSCNPARSSKDVTEFTQYKSIMSMRFGPYKGGTMALYYTSIVNGGVMRRVYYTNGGVMNRPPNARIDIDAQWVEQGGSITFSGTSSSDPDGDELLYEWDFDGDGVIDSRLAQETVTFTTSGLYHATLTVRDGSGGKDTSSVQFVVGTPPSGGYPGVLFPWMSGDECPAGYEFCGVLEFCQGRGDNQFGYRLPCSGKDCKCESTPGPLIRLIPGHKYRLTLRNVAREPTNLHTHGLHIVGDGDSDDVIRTVSGGEYCLDYTWDIASDHPGGTYWYHAHYHGLSEKQVVGGAYGMLIVEDNTVLNSPPLWTKNEHLLQVVKTEDRVRGNGRKNEIIVMNASQWYRLRVSFVSVNGVPLNFTFADKGGCDVHKVATDGIWRSVVPGPTARRFEMTGASRADFAIRCTSTGSLVPLHYGDQVAATILVGPTETSLHVMEEWYPVRPYSLQDLSSEDVPEGNKFRVLLGYDHVNNLEWDPDVAMATIGYDQVHEWSLHGTGEHPFHLHLYHMQVVSPGGCGVHEEGEFYDVIAAPNDCLVRFRTADIGQRCVVHCHVLFHEDNGSMAWVNVTSPGMPRNDVQSPEYACPADIGSQPDPTNPPAWCNPTPVLVPTEMITAGERIDSPHLDLFLQQQYDGNLVLLKGSPDGAKSVLWASGFSGTRGDYYTRLERNGELVTLSGRPNNATLPKVWSSGTRGKASSNYFLAFNCDGSTISIYRGEPSDPEGEIWTIQV